MNNELKLIDSRYGGGEEYNTYEYRGYTIEEYYYREDDCTHHICDIFKENKHLNDCSISSVKECMRIIDNLIGGK